MTLSSAVVIWKRSETISRAVGVPVALCCMRPPVFERPLKDSGEEEGNDESAVSELVGQLLMSVALCKAELLEFISEAL
jgi:hypothetical protein